MQRQEGKQSDLVHICGCTHDKFLLHGQFRVQHIKSLPFNHT